MFSDSVDSLPLDFLPEIGDRIDLDPACIDRVATFSETLPESIRWQSYLALLALEGFTAWIEEQTISIQLERSQARLLQPACFDSPAAITHVALNQLRVCLIVVDAADDVIECPIAVVDEWSQTAHLYVAIAVDDEQRQTEVQGFIRRDQLAQYLQRAGLQPTDDYTYLLPKAIFDFDLHHLLLFATGLRPAAIARSTVPPRSLPAIQQILLQAVVNTASWAQQQVSRLANELQQLTDEIILTGASPELQIADAMRSSQATDSPSEHRLFSILEELQQQGYEIPNAVRAAFQDVVIGDQKLRLSLVTWQLSPAISSAMDLEWSLLAIAEIVQGTAPAEGIRIVIREQQTVILEKTLVPGVAYEVAQAIGTLDEQFIITLSLPSGDSLTLPPLAFQS